jgi:hypothetical protein
MEPVEGAEMITRTVLLLTILVAAPGYALAQIDAKARDEAYSRCTTFSRDTEATYKACKDYLDKFPNDDYQRSDTATKFIRAYDRAAAYASALQTYALSQPNTWFIYEPDLKIDLPNVDEKQGSYSIKIQRSFKNAAESAMLRKAEAVYGPQSRYINSMRQSPVQWAESLPAEIAPLWGATGNDNVIDCDVITASAVRYYYDLSISSREHRQFRNVYPMVATGLTYNASIKHYDDWEHRTRKFHDVYVADLNLEWSSICGGLCGIGFTRNKLVVLDQRGEVLELFLDAAVNHQGWVAKLY